MIGSGINMIEKLEGKPAGLGVGVGVGLGVGLGLGLGLPAIVDHGPQERAPQEFSRDAGH